MKNLADTQKLISRAFADRSLVAQKDVQEAMAYVLRELEAGRLRVASPAGLGPTAGNVEMTGDLRTWEVHAWVKEAVLLTLGWRRMRLLGSVSKETDSEQGRVHGQTLSYFDKLDVRSDLAEKGVRVVPPGTVREGAYVSKGAVIMPGYVNIGAYVSEGVMVDTWATVGSCAQIGARVHLAGGVGIGGVLEPAGARPVIIGDDAFIGSRCIVVEGAIVSNRAVLGAGVCITATTPVYDVTKAERTEFRGYVPPGAVVAPGTREREFPGGKVPLQCAYIIGYRNEQTDARVGINDILRENGLGV